MRKHSFLILILLLGIILRLWGIRFGLPFFMHPDEPKLIEPAITWSFQIKEILAGNWSLLDPKFYYYPSFLMYLLFGLLSLARLVHSVIPFPILDNKETFYLMARLISVICGVGQVFLIYRIGAKLSSKTVGLLAGLFTAISVLLVRESHYYTGDIPAGFLMLFSLYLMIKWTENPKKYKYLIFSAVTIGLGVATKYYPILMLAPLTYLVHSVQRGWERRFKTLFLSCVLILGVFVATVPFSVINHRQFISEFIESSLRSREGVLGYVDPNPLGFLVNRDPSFHDPFSQNGLFQGISPFFLILAIYGIYHLRRKVNYIPIFILSATYYLFFAVHLTKIIRWMVPITPLILLFSAVGLVHLLQANNFRKWVGVLIMVFGVLWNLGHVIVIDYAFSNSDSRIQTYVYLDEKLHDKSRVAFDYFGIPGFTQKEYEYLEFVHPRYNSHGEIDSSLPPDFEYLKNVFKPEFIIVNGSSRDRRKLKNMQKLFSESCSSWNEFYARVEKDYNVERDYKPQLFNNVESGPEMIIYVPK